MKSRITWLRRLAVRALICGICWLWGAAADAGTALRLDGTNAFAQITAGAAFNAFPLTVTAWVRTTNQDLLIRGIASHYKSSSLNGWSVYLYGGHVRAWYFRDASDYVWDGSLGLDGGLIADGAWHQVAFVVDGGGARLVVDGGQRDSRGWTRSPGAPTSTEPLLIGRLDNFVPSFRGEIDEVSIWSEALSLDALNYMKHRVLSGQEAGLLALWHLDDAGGNAALDAVGNHHPLNLVGAPPWIPSTAPVVLAPVAGTALKLNGVSDQIDIPHQDAQNALPITLMTWIKTSQSVGAYPGIMTKYQGGAGAGWALALNAGRLAPWYYADLTDYVEPGFSSAGDRFVADGQWHHVAFVVDATSGRTFIDGQLVNTQPWNNNPGPTTSLTDVRLGTYVGGSGQFFNGQLDHASIWNAALTPAQINQYAHLPLTGAEPGLVSAYEFDEAGGNVATDLAGLSDGTASGVLTRTGSLARIGDGSQYLLGSLDYAAYGRLWSIQNSPAYSSFPLPAQATVRRFYDYGDAPAPLGVSATLSATVQDAGGAAVPLQTPATLVNTLTLGAYNASAPPPPGAVVTFSTILNVTPANQLQSVSDRYSAGVVFAHLPDGGTLVTDEENDLPLATWLHFNGHLFFDGNDTTFTSVANNPARGGNDLGGFDTQLAVNANSGTLLANPAYHYGNGTTLVAVLGDDGNATELLPGVSLFGPVPDVDCSQNICYIRTNVVMAHGAGIHGTVQLQLPLGLAVAGGVTNHVATNQITFFNQALDATLHPQSAELVLPGPLWAIEETKPFWVGASSLHWVVNGGQILLPGPNPLYFTRQSEDDFLDGARATLTDSTAATRVSNDGYYRNLTLAAGASVVVTADTNNVARLTTQLALNPPELRPHFPYAGRAAGNQISVGAGATLSILNDQVDPGSSSLPVMGAVPVIYSQDCGDTNCSGATIGKTSLAFSPDGGALQFTPDGGLLGFGAIPPVGLKWGYAGGTSYAQETSPVSAGVYRMPGTFVLGGQFALPPEQQAPAMLFTGVGDATTSDLRESPDHPADYAGGQANYAGLNFRRPATGRSYLANLQIDSYPLTDRAKYYVRYGGVSGIHEAASFPPNLTLYGYHFNFSSYRLSFLDSQTRESRTDGQVVLPYPAGFTQNFERMQFFCRGGLDSARVPANSPADHLVYWNTDLLPQTIDFRPLATEVCDTATRFLVLGVETKLPFIPQAFHATLGFQADGNLTTAAMPLQGCNSRFAPPPGLNLQGPGNSTFTLATVGDSYFNNYGSPHRPDEGFYNIAGKIKTPFFGEVKVHLHVRPTGTNSANVYVMGGWPKAEGTGLNLGWRDSNNYDFFTGAKFDLNHDGFPQSLATVDAYRNSKTEDYHPRAQRDWIEVAKFDYALSWSPLLHKFTGFQKDKAYLPVIDVDSNLKELTPGKVDFDFAQDLTLALPRIKVLDFVNDAIDEAFSPLNSLTDALHQAIAKDLDTSGATSGFQSLQAVLREDAGPFFRPLLADPAGPLLAAAGPGGSVVDQIYNQLALAYQNDPAGFPAKVSGIVTDPANGLGGAISTLNGAVGQANGVLGKMQHTYSDVDDTIGLFLRVVEKDGQGQRHVISTLVKKLVEDQLPELGLVGDIADQAAADLTAELEPTLSQIELELRDLRSQFAGVKDTLNSATGDLPRALDDIVHDTVNVQPFLQAAGTAVADLCATSVTPSGDYFTANPNAVKDAIRERLTLAFLGSPIVGGYQKDFRQFFGEGSSLLDQLLDVLFDQINRAIRDGIEKQVGQGNDGVFQALKGIGQMTQSLASAKIRGAPTFEGDSLRRIHLDGNIQMNLPDAMTFQAYLDIKELDSSSTPLDCIPPGAPSAEVTLGAKNIPLNWAGVSGGGPPLTLTIEARWTLQSGAVLGVGGLIDIKGKADFKGCSIKEVGATFAIGEIENYLAAKVAGSVVVFGVPVDVHAGFFAGHACDLNTLKFVDPDVAAVLGNPVSFTGIYIEYGGGLSLSEILFGISSCLLDIEAEVTCATYYEGGPRSGKIGFRQKDSIDLSLLCLLSGHVETTMGVAAGVGPGGPELDFSGSAEICGSIGYCPFCVSACKGISIRGVVTDGGLNFSIDY